MAADFVYSLEPLPAGAGAPEVAADFVGVAVACPARIALSGEWRLNGLFQLPRAELETIHPQPHRALVVVATLGAGWFADSPLRDKIFFPDDLEPAGHLVRGRFSFDLFSLFADRVPGEYRLLVSLGEYLSESLRVEVG